MNKLIPIGIIIVIVGVISVLVIDQFNILSIIVNTTQFTMIENATIPQNIVTRNNEFAIDFYKQISSNDGNLFFSPLSMYTTFSLLYEGADENTANEMQQVFGFEPNDIIRYIDTVHLLSAINRDDLRSTLNLSNRLWIADWFVANDDYIKIAREAYLSDVDQINFENDGVSKINGWVSDNTHGKINKVVTQKNTTNDTAAIIANTVYFEGTLFTDFFTDQVHEFRFYTSDAFSSNYVHASPWEEESNFKFVYAYFMNAETNIKYALLNGSQVIEIPYKGDRLSMLVILPYNINIKQLEESISVEQIKQWKDNLTLQNVLVLLPKFETSTHYDLNPLLTELGMPTVFDKMNANLRDIGSADDKNLFIESATQDAYLKVNKEGIEYLPVGPRGGVEYATTPPFFVADHQFIFIIQDDSSGAILFMGRVSNPAI